MTLPIPIKSCRQHHTSQRNGCLHPVTRRWCCLCLLALYCNSAPSKPAQPAAEPGPAAAVSLATTNPPEVQQQQRLDALVQLGKSSPRQANQGIDNWLAELSAEDDLALREKLINAKAFNLLVLAEYAGAEQLLQDWLNRMKTQQPQLTTRALELLGAIEMRRGHIDKAQAWLQQALTQADRFGQTERQITARIYSAMQAVYAGQDEAALDILLLAQQMNQQARFSYLRVNIENNLNSVRIRLGQYQQALESLLPALTDPDYQSADRLYVRFSISSALLRLGRIDEAKPYLQQALQGYQQREDPYYLSALYLMEAEIALHELQPDAARAAVTRCIDIARSQQLTEQLSDAYLLASKISQVQQRPQQAFDELQQHLHFYKQVRNQQTQRQTLLLRSQLETLQQQHHIDTLQSQLTLSEMQHQLRQKLWATGSLSALALFALLLLILRLQQKKRRQAEQHSAELASAYARLQQTQRELVNSEKMAALAGLVAGLAHELNTPLGILTTAASLNSEKTEEFAAKFSTGLRKSDVEEYLQTVQASQQLCLHNIARASQLVQSFKQLAVPSDLQLSEFWLDQLITDLLRLQASKLSNAQVTTDYHACHVKLAADPRHFQLLLLELVNNAVTHAFTDQPQRLISITAQARSSSLLLTVQDNGKGLTEQQRDKAFEPFYTTGRPAGHTGLGLNLVYNLVTLALGGQIRLEDAAPGLRVCVELPASWLCPQQH